MDLWEISPLLTRAEESVHHPHNKVPLCNSPIKCSCQHQLLPEQVHAAQQSIDNEHCQVFHRGTYQETQSIRRIGLSEMQTSIVQSVTSAHFSGSWLQLNLALLEKGAKSPSNRNIPKASPKSQTVTSCSCRIRNIALLLPLYSWGDLAEPNH